MPDEYSISTLSPAPTISNNDLVELACVDQSSETGFTSFNAKMTDLGNKFNNDIEYASALETSEKKPLGAINQVLHNFANTYSPSSTYALDECVVYQGTLYKCTTAITTAEAWNSAHWTAIKAVDVGSASILYGTSAPSSSAGSDGNLYVQYTEGTGGESDTVDGLFVKLDGEWCEISTGGGTGGGHIIVDDEGTSLAQQPNLQFNGAYLEDNSTDETTEVNIVRSMTYAEFQQLPEAEKKGFIDVSDITGYEQDKFQPVIYSTEEREIGVWTDGKPLYQRTVELTNITIAVSGGYSYDISSWNVDTMVKNPEGFITLSNDTDLRTVPFGILGNYAVDITSTRSAVQFSRKGGDLTCNRVVFTLTYTKTTDVAGSGKWTPQGLPSVHYSEGEQVVGTWIDGSTIYEKTLAFEPFSIGGGTTVAHGISSIDIIVDYDIIMVRQDGTTIKFAWATTNNSSTTVSINKTNIVFAGNDTWGTSNYTKLYATIRYTKSNS